MKVKFEIIGKVKAKQSFKFAKNGIKYTPRDIVEYANLVKISFINSYPTWNIQNFKDKPLKVQIDVFKSIPTTYNKKKHLNALQGNLRPLVKPDCDNIAKNINDSLNGVVFPDDKQIVSLTINKYYSENEKVIISIESLE